MLFVLKEPRAAIAVDPTEPHLGHTAVDYTVKKSQENGNYLSKSRSERPRATREIDAEIDAGRRKSISVTTIKRRLFKAGLKLLYSTFVFQQDNDVKHASKLRKDYLQYLEVDGTIRVMEWPPERPDLNPMVLLWEFDGEVRKLRIIPDTLTKLIARMPRLCAAVIKNKRGRIDESQV
ncbi:hypothetical protein Trydic_g16421 [Trypoxylus dichotomus]